MKAAEVPSFTTELAWPPEDPPTRCFPAALRYGKRQPPVRPAPGRRLDHNVDIPAQPRQAFQQTVLRNPAKPPLQEVGNLGLCEPQNLGCVGLGERSPPEDLGYLGGQLGLNQHALTIRIPEIGIHIPRTFLDRHAPHNSLFLHRDSSLAICAASGLLPEHMQHEHRALEPYGVHGSIRTPVPILDNLQHASGAESFEGPGRACKSRFELPIQCSGFRDGGLSISVHYTYIGITSPGKVAAPEPPWKELFNPPVSSASSSACPVPCDTADCAGNRALTRPAAGGLPGASSRADR